MPELRSMESVKADLAKVEQYNDTTTTSPGRNGGAASAGKPAGEKMELRRTKGRYAHAGGDVTRQIK